LFDDPPWSNTAALVSLTSRRPNRQGYARDPEEIQLRFGLSPIQSEQRFAAMQRQAELTEALGYDVLWAHEHHAGAAMYPSPLMTLATLAASTRRIGLVLNASCRM
jgi:hypothetical protein